MLKNIFVVALLAGFVSGAGISLVQEVTTTPLILQAEQFEHADAGSTGFRLATFVLAHGDASQDEAGAADWAPADGLERFAFTALSNILVSVGFALLLVASYVIYGSPVSGRNGVIWGLAGCAVFVLAPGLGLPPEAPGSMAAELTARQGWWLAAAGATALGLWMTVFCKNWPLRILGIVAIAAPHVAGAPHPQGTADLLPAELAAQFASASLITGVIFWVMLGWLSGTLYQRTVGDS